MLMPLLEVLTIEVGGAIAKSIVKLWVKDSSLWGNIPDSIIDMLKSVTSDQLAQRKGNRQFEAIGEKVGESLLPLFASEGARLDEGSRMAVAYAVAEAFNARTISSETLAKKNLDPTALSKEILANFTLENKLFNEAETNFYQRIIEEACRYIVNIAS